MAPKYDQVYGTSIPTWDRIIVELESLKLFADMLSFYCSRNNIKNADLANTIHVSPPTITYWKNGQRLPSAQDLPTIAAGLHLNSVERHHLFLSLDIDKSISEWVLYLKGSKDKASVQSTIQHIQIRLREWSREKAMIESLE